jgi:glycosyltransferase involved in cell wall biosynthesis
MKLSIIIPVYNEVGTLKAIFQRLTDVSFPVDLEFIMVDDCSSDGSRDVITELAAKDPRIQPLFKEKNEGKSSALAAGFKQVTGDFAIVQDADLEYDPSDIPALLQLLIENRADVVYGSRFSHRNSQVVRFYHYLGNKLLTLCSNFMSDIRLSDMETCYKCFRSEIIKNIIIETKRFGFEPEVTAKIAKLELRIHEMPVTYNQRSYAQGKKIGVWDGFEALWCILKYNKMVSPKSCFTSELPAKYLRRHGLYS